MRKFTAKTVDEFEKDGRYYALLKISNKEGEAFCIFACDGESVIEGLNISEELADDIFIKIAKGEASIIHIGEIINDITREIFA